MIARQRISTSCTRCDGTGWLTTGRLAPCAGGGITCDVAIAEIVRCPARCDGGVFVLATDVGARVGEKVPDAAPKLCRRFVMHLHESAGHRYGYELTRGPDGPVIGHISKFSPSPRARSKGAVPTTVYRIAGREFVDDPKAVLAAYQQMLRDEEWEAAAPTAKPPNNCEGENNDHPGQ